MVFKKAPRHYLLVPRNHGLRFLAQRMLLRAPRRFLMAPRLFQIFLFSSIVLFKSLTPTTIIIFFSLLLCKITKEHIKLLSNSSRVEKMSSLKYQTCGYKTHLSEFLGQSELNLLHLMLKLLKLKKVLVIHCIYLKMY